MSNSVWMCKVCGIQCQHQTTNAAMCARRQLKFERGGDDKCTICGKAEGDHIHHPNGNTYCREGTSELAAWSACCNCLWDGEKESSTFEYAACQRCKNRRSSWGQATTLVEFINRLFETELELLIAKGAYAEALSKVKIAIDGTVQVRTSDSTHMQSKSVQEEYEFFFSSGPPKYESKSRKIMANILLASDIGTAEDFKRLVDEQGTLDASPRYKNKQRIPPAMCAHIVTKHAANTMLSCGTKCLDVGSNPYLKIPAEELSTLTKSLSKLECQGCSRLCCPPPEIAALGGSKVISYLKSAIDHGVLNTAIEMVCLYIFFCFSCHLVFFLIYPSAFSFVLN
jgi:hypothetical protein